MCKRPSRCAQHARFRQPCTLLSSSDGDAISCTCSSPSPHKTPSGITTRNFRSCQTCLRTHTATTMPPRPSSLGPSTPPPAEVICESLARSLVLADGDAAAVASERSHHGQHASLHTRRRPVSSHIREGGRPVGQWERAQGYARALAACACAHLPRLRLALFVNAAGHPRQETTPDRAIQEIVACDWQQAHLIPSVMAAPVEDQAEDVVGERSPPLGGQPRLERRETSVRVVVDRGGCLAVPKSGNVHCRFSPLDLSLNLVAHHTLTHSAPPLRPLDPRRSPTRTDTSAPGMCTSMDTAEAWWRQSRWETAGEHLGWKPGGKQRLLPGACAPCKAHVAIVSTSSPSPLWTGLLSSSPSSRQRRPPRPRLLPAGPAGRSPA